MIEGWDFNTVASKFFNTLDATENTHVAWIPPHLFPDNNQ